MRKPRPQDFDPDYKLPASLQPEAIDIQGSVPIKPHATVKKAVAPDRTENRSEKRTKIRSEFRSENRSTALPIKRRTKRYSFEFYDDQIQQIRRIKIETEMQGETIAMSEIVRMAIDQYLNNQ